MNKKQIKVLWIGIFIFVLIGIFPPLKDWPRPVRDTNIPQIYTIFDSGIKVDGTKLFVYWSIIIVLTGGLIYTFKDKKDEKPKDEQQ